KIIFEVSATDRPNKVAHTSSVHSAGFRPLSRMWAAKGIPLSKSRRYSPANEGNDASASGGAPPAYARAVPIPIHISGRRSASTLEIVLAIAEGSAPKTHHIARPTPASKRRRF